MFQVAFPKPGSQTIMGAMMRPGLSEPVENPDDIVEIDDDAAPQMWALGPTA